MMKGWSEKRLNDFVWFQRGYDLPKTKFEDGIVPVYGSTSVLGYHNIAKVKAPGVVTGRSGTLGVLQYADQDFWPHNTSLWVKDFKGNNERFAYYLLKCLDFSLFNSGGAVPTLNRNVLNSFIVNVPPLPIQRKIAAILSAYDDLIENNLKRIKLLEEKAQLTYEEWFVRMRFPGHETTKIDEETGLPEGWEKKKIKKTNLNLIDGDRGKNYPKQSDFFDDEYCLFLNTGNVTSSGFKFSSLKFINQERDNILRKGKLELNDLVLTTRGTIGNVAFYTKDIRYNNVRINSGMLILRSNEIEVLPHYLHQVFISELIQKTMSVFSYGAAQPQLPIGTLENIEICIPDMKIQKSFSSIMKNINSICDYFRNQNYLLKEARDILLPRLMTGMIDVTKMPESGYIGLKD